MFLELETLLRIFFKGERQNYVMKKNEIKTDENTQFRNIGLQMEFLLGKIIQKYDDDITSEEFLKQTIPNERLDQIIRAYKSLIELNPADKFSKRELVSIKNVVKLSKKLKRINSKTKKVFDESKVIQKNYAELTKDIVSLDDLSKHLATISNKQVLAKKLKISPSRIQDGIKLNLQGTSLKFQSYDKAQKFLKSDKFQNFVRAKRNNINFTDARNEVRKFGIKNRAEFYKAKKIGLFRDIIPGEPSIVFKSEWKGWDDWLGINAHPQYMKFEDARKFVHNLELKDAKDWARFVHTGSIPDNIPVKPEIVYKKKWLGLSDWIGNDSETFGESELLNDILDIADEEPKKGLKKLDEFLKKFPENTIGLLNKGILLNEIGKSKESLEFFDKCIKIDVKDSEAHFQKGVAYLDLDKFKMAEKCFLHSNKLESKHVGTLTNLGYIYLELKNYAKAERYTKLALKIEKDNDTAMLNLAELYLIKNKVKDASSIISKIMRIDRTIPDAWFLKSMCDAILKKKEVDVMESMLVALAIDPTETKELYKRNRKIFSNYEKEVFFKNFLLRKGVI